MLSLGPLRRAECASESHTGRDGEAVDILDARRKPRISLAPGAMLLSAGGVLSGHPACEILDLSPWQTAAGTAVFARVRDAGEYEIADRPQVREFARQLTGCTSSAAIA